MDNLKKIVYSFCLTHVQDKINRIHSEIEKIEAALRSETKSAAGDKHETGRAMVQLEREKFGQQLRAAEEMMLVIKRIDPKQSHKRAALGSIVNTNKNTYFLAIPAGECLANDQVVYCISMASPIGQLMLGKAKGEVVLFRNDPQMILNIY